MNSNLRYHRRRLADTAAGLRLARNQLGREQGPRAHLAAHQQRRLEAVVRHAATHSPFYRRWFAETGALGHGPVELARLPVLDKVLLMEHFDELVCDPVCAVTSCWTGPGSWPVTGCTWTATGSW
jgi:phenylacetate-CoA ligase